jgi:hypothetical protein
MADGGVGLSSPGDAFEAPPDASANPAESLHGGDIAYHLGRVAGSAEVAGKTDEGERSASHAVDQQHVHARKYGCALRVPLRRNAGDKL